MTIFILAIIATAISFYGKWKGDEFIGIRSIIAGGFSLACVTHSGSNMIILVMSILLLMFNVVLLMTPSKSEYEAIQVRRRK